MGTEIAVKPLHVPRCTELRSTLPRRAEHPGAIQSGHTAAATRTQLTQSRRSLATLFALALLMATPAAASDSSPFDFDPPVPEQFQYAESYESKPPSFSFRRNQSRAVEAPTRYRTSSILQYTTPLGETGLILRVKMPLKAHKIIKFEIRF